MKNVLMILILFGGFALNASAQQNCKPANCAPCPPECCIINCCASKGSAASATPTSEAQLTSLMLGSSSCNMTKKEIKACKAACKANAETTTVSITPSCKPYPTCQPTTACKPQQQSPEATPAVYRASVQSKS